jgi:hypothetical protein
MAAQGAHAVWYDPRHQHLDLPWNVRLLVSFVPPVSGLATLHLVVRMAEDLIGTVRMLTAPEPDVPGVDVRVLEIARRDPQATWRVVQDGTGLTDANAKRALTAARKALAS